MIGQTLSHYQILEKLGEGGMGVVYKARDNHLDRLVAIKVLPADRVAHADSKRRFVQEAKAASALNHPNIVTIYDINQADGVYFIAMEFVAGKPLDRLIPRQGLELNTLLKYGVQVADALSAAHAAGIVHRDLKPGNLMVTDRDLVKVLDFGLAKLAATPAIAESDDTETLVADSLAKTQEGVILGTVSYMSPEQAEGKLVDARSDIFSLGSVLYEMVTGRKAFQGETKVSTLTAILRDEPKSPGEIVAGLPKEVERIVFKCLEKRAAHRYPDAAALKAELTDLLSLPSDSNKARVVLEPGIVASPSAVPRSMAREATPTPTPVRADTLTPASQRSSREAERRQLTVLVCGCQVFESDAFLELDSEEQARMLQAFQERCEEAVRRFAGTVVQCTDKGLLACFGFPVAYEDAAGRAARAGRAILNALKLSSESMGRHDALELHPWVGIHTGAAVVESKAGAVSLVGEARNVAVRLENVAVVGQVICTDASHRLFQGQFQCASLGRQKIMSVTHPVELFRVEHIATTGSPIDAVAPAELSPLIGRDQEIGLLTARWEQAREGMGQVVLLIGEPGLGKSRLVHTVKQQILGQMIEGEVDAPVIEWRCSPHFQNTGLYPAIDFYERALAFDREEPPQARFDRLLHRLDQYDLARPETVPLWASLLSLPTPDRYPPLSLSPVRQREETFRIMLEWLHTRAARKPVLFIVEDLHWVDASTLEFLGQFLAEGLHDSILTLLTFRPEFKTPWPAVAHQTSLALNRLTRHQVRDLMRKKTKREVPEAVVQQVYDRTGGVPLFVEEFTKMVQESSVPDKQGEGSARGPMLLGHGIPATLQDLVMARLDRMEGEREVAQLASALGREFAYEVLAAVTALDELTLQAELAKLVEAEILYPKGPPPRCRYIFKHALLEDALYNTLVKGKRQQFHGRIARVLEAEFPKIVETQPELLAHHLTDAGLPEKAVGYWLKAGLRSQGRCANVEAAGHLTRGLELVGTLHESPERDALELEFLNPLGTVYIAAHGYAAPEVGPVFARARELCERVGQPGQRFAIMWGVWIWHLVRADLLLCADLAREAVALAEQAGDPGMLMEALFLPGVTSTFRGEFATAREACTRALELDDRERTRFWAQITGEDSGVAHRCYLSMALWHLGNPDQALKLDHEAVELARTIGQPFTLAFALEHRAWLCNQSRLAAEARAAAEEGIAIATDQGFAFWLAMATLLKIDSMVLQGHRSEALPLLAQGIHDLRAIGGRLDDPLHLAFLGSAFTQAGRFEEAAKTLDEGLALVEKTDARLYEAELQRLQGELHLADTNNEGAAEECFHTAIATARRQQSKAWELRATTSLARLWQRQGRGEEARSALAAVYGSFTEGFLMPDLVDARVLLESLTGHDVSGARKVHTTGADG